MALRSFLISYIASPGGPCTQRAVVSGCYGRGVLMGKFLLEHSWSEKIDWYRRGLSRDLVPLSRWVDLTFRAVRTRFRVDFTSISHMFFVSRRELGTKRPSLARVVKPISLCGFATQNHHFWLELGGPPRQFIEWILAVLAHSSVYRALAWWMVAVCARRLSYVGA